MRDIDKRLLDAAHDGDLRSLREALAAGAAPNAIDKEREEATPLMLACLAGSPLCVQELLPKSDPSALTERGQTALMMCSGSAECVELLLPVSDPRHADAEGNTALMAAAEMGDPDSVEMLIPVSDPKARGAKGWTALMAAAAAGCEDCVGLLLPVSDVGAWSDFGLSAADWARSEGHAVLASAIEASALSQKLYGPGRRLQVGLVGRSAMGGAAVAPTGLH